MEMGSRGSYGPLAGHASPSHQALLRSCPPLPANLVVVRTSGSPPASAFVPVEHMSYGLGYSAATMEYKLVCVAVLLCPERRAYRHEVSLVLDASIHALQAERARHAVLDGEGGRLVLAGVLMGHGVPLAVDRNGDRMLLSTGRWLGWYHRYRTTLDKRVRAVYSLGSWDTWRTGEVRPHCAARESVPANGLRKPSTDPSVDHMRHAVLSLQIILLLSSFGFSIQRQYKSIFSFGDSYTDTGNLAIISAPAGGHEEITKPPNGMTFFGHPTGRLSDGRVAIDFIAEALGLPLLAPSWSANQSFRQGANFAVASATALNRTFYLLDGDSGVSPFNISLGDQLAWFDAMKPTLCNSPQACKKFFADALFVVGEFGWNDYKVMLFANKTVADARSHVPLIVEMISAATEKLINEGGKAILVSGLTPMGCAPMNLALFGSHDGADYDPGTGCLKDLNLLCRHHNRLLRRSLRRLKRRHPRVRITYADFYTPIHDFVVSPDRYGFNGTDGVFRTCCGSGGGRYNFNRSTPCGTPGVSACEDPSAYLNWDGVHFSEAANRRIADGWLRGPFAHPPILKTY
ncbi:hypothetical protein ACP70R_021384 [Stipagrostis hirtigluma subsp. patula]